MIHRLKHVRKWAATGKTWAKLCSNYTLAGETGPSARRETIHNLLQSCLHRYYDIVGPIDHTNIWFNGRLDIRIGRLTIRTLWILYHAKILCYSFTQVKLIAILKEIQWKSDWPIMRETYCSIITNFRDLSNIRCNTQSGAGIMLKIVKIVSTRMILTYVYLSFTITRKMEWKPSIYKEYIHKWCPTYFFVYKGSSFDLLTIRVDHTNWPKTQSLILWYIIKTYYTLSTLFCNRETHDRYNVQAKLHQTWPFWREMVAVLAGNGSCSPHNSHQFCAIWFLWDPYICRVLVPTFSMFSKNRNV